MNVSPLPSGASAAVLLEAFVPSSGPKNKDELTQLVACFNGASLWKSFANEGNEKSVFDGWDDVLPDGGESGVHAFTATGVLSSSALPMFSAMATPPNGLLTLLSKEISPLIVSPGLKATIAKISTLINDNMIDFKQAYENHLLHDLVTEVTLEVRKDKKIQPLWESFLKRLHNQAALYPNGQVFLDFSPQLDLLKDPNLLPTKHKIKVEKLTPQSQGLEDKLTQIFSIGIDSFGFRDALRLEDIRSRIKNPKQGVFAALDESSNQVLGFVMVCDESEQKFHITAVARRANAAKRGVATIILTEIFAKHIPPESTTVLEARKSNVVAIELYKKFKFVDKGLKPQNGYYYVYPNEDAIDMAREPENAVIAFGAAAAAVPTPTPVTASASAPILASAAVSAKPAVLLAAEAPKQAPEAAALIPKPEAALAVAFIPKLAAPIGAAAS